MKVKLLFFIFILSLLTGLGCIAVCADFEPIMLPDTYKNSENDDFLSKTVSNTVNCFAEKRAVQGLSQPQQNDILHKDAAYLATILLLSGETEKNGIEDLLEPQIAAISYISGWTYVVSKGFYATDSKVAGKYIAKTVLNNDRKYRIFAQNYEAYGCETVSAEIGGETVICAVFLWAQSMEAVCDDADPIPVKWFADDTIPPVVTQKSAVYIKTGTDISEEDILNAIEISGEEAGVTVTFDETAIDILTPETYLLPVSFTDSAGNETLCDIEVIVGDDAPYLKAEIITLPEIPEGQLWNVGYYVECATKCGGLTVETSPAFICSGMPLPETVSVTVTNVFGNSVTAELPIQTEERAYLAVDCPVTDTGGGMKVKISDGNEIVAGGHCLITATEAESATYIYSIEDPLGNVSKYVLTEPSLVWNPDIVGNYALCLTVKTGGQTIGGTVLQVSVAQKQEIVYNKPVLTFSEESGIVIDGAIIRGIKSETAFAAVKEIASMTGGIGELTLALNEGNDETVIATGTVIKFLEGEQTVAELTVIIAGDINCDGKVGIADFAKMRQVLLGNIELDEVLTAAGDINGDGKVGIADFAKMRQVLLGNLEL